MGWLPVVEEQGGAVNNSIAIPVSGQVARRTLKKFETYLFRPGGPYALAICRIGLFFYLYLHVYKGVLGMSLGDPDYYSKVNITAYRAKSLLFLLFPNNPPPIEFVQVVLWVAAATTLCAIFGLATRIAMVLSVATLTFLAALMYAWEPLWSHPFNSGLLAGIGFMFGRAGDVLSIDCLIARYVFRRPIATNRRVYWWPVILGLFGTATLYFGGFYAKWSTPDWSYNFSWVFSDNLRNSMSLPWLIWGKPLPWQVDLIVNNPWFWKLAAFGHLVMQMLPMLAMFSLNKPYLRLAEGVIFVLGVALLKMTMGFWNPEWMILVVFFVDWEYFLKNAGVPLAPSERARAIQNPCLVSAFAMGFMMLNLIVIVTRYDDRGTSRLYPFSSMNFYSSVAAAKPYSEHKFYPFLYSELEMEYEGGAHSKLYCASGLNSMYLSALYNNPVEDKLSQQFGAIQTVTNMVKSYGGDDIGDCEGSVSTKDYRAIDLYTSVLDIPPYPDRVRFEVGFRALVGRYERDTDRVIAASGSLRNIKKSYGKISIDVRTQGLDVERYTILLANDPWRNYAVGELIEPTGVWKAQTFEIDPVFYKAMTGGSYPIVVRITERSGRKYDFFGGVLPR
jgi:hypothetical protein